MDLSSVFLVALSGWRLGSTTRIGSPLHIWKIGYIHATGAGQGLKSTSKGKLNRIQGYHQSDSLCQRVLGPTSASVNQPGPRPLHVPLLVALFCPMLILPHFYHLRDGVVMSLAVTVLQSQSCTCTCRKSHGRGNIVHTQTTRSPPVLAANPRGRG